MIFTKNQQSIISILLLVAFSAVTQLQIENTPKWQLVIFAIAMGAALSYEHLWPDRYAPVSKIAAIGLFGFGLLFWGRANKPISPPPWWWVWYMGILVGLEVVLLIRRLINPPTSSLNSA